MRKPATTAPERPVSTTGDRAKGTCVRWRRVWTLTEAMQVREEWLVIRRDLDGRLTFVLLNDPAETLPDVLIRASCQRYFTERTYQDATF